ncbi:hypothetical protein [Enhygromyxa salina]|uniref:hypothetical protein n=1 Tax=Enhygromyxa salina TaxID=215803 RepID=UPI000D08E511|nr:hypothetical protein [Enhygromyxa salina]
MRDDEFGAPTHEEIADVARWTHERLGTDAGKLHKLPLPHPNKAPQALAHLPQLAPGATDGYSEALRQRFKSDPTSLRSGTPT